MNTILQLIAAGESKTLELKKELPRGEQLAITAVAFANASGGKIVIGVDDNRNIIGIAASDADELRDKVVNILYDSIAPMLRPDVYLQNSNGKILLVIDVRLESNTPYFLKARGRENGVYIRLGATNRIADEQTIFELERNKLNISYDADADRSLEIVPAELLPLLQQRIPKHGINETTLENLGLHNPHRTPPLVANACALLLGLREETQIRCARIKGNSDYVFLDRKDCNGDLFTQIEQAKTFIQNHLQLRSRKVNNLNRVSEYEIPLDAITEALLNAVIHRDYAVSRIFTKVTVYDDRVEIMTPGGLPRGLPLDDALNGRSEPRNRILARIFHEAEWIEQWGIGLPKIRKLCEDANLRAPQFTDSGSTFTVKIYRPVNTNAAERTKANESERNRTKANESVAPYKPTILKLLADKTEITNTMVMQACNLGKTQAAKILKTLISLDELQIIGSGRTTRYIIKSENQPAEK